jgi:ribosomal protein L6, bacterial type
LSRLGKKPIPIPKGVDVKIADGKVVVKGPKGTLSRDYSPQVKVEVADSQVVCVAERDRISMQLWGLTRMLISNMITGVTTGYRKVLDIEGVGYKAEVKGDSINIVVGYSHPVLIKAAAGITLKTETPTRISIEGADKEMVGRVASEMRKVRPPEPYKAKGIRYADEHIRRKVGKAAGK